MEIEALEQQDLEPAPEEATGRPAAECIEEGCWWSAWDEEYDCDWDWLLDCLEGE